MKAKGIIAIVALTLLPGSEGSTLKGVLSQTIIPVQVRDAGDGEEGMGLADKGHFWRELRR